MTKPLRMSKRDAARLAGNVAPKAKPVKVQRDYRADAMRGALLVDKLTPRARAALLRVAEKLEAK